MERVKAFIRPLLNIVPVWLIVVIILTLTTILLIILVIKLLSRFFFANKLKKIKKDPDLAGSLIKQRYTSRSLLRKSSIIERFANKENPRVVKLTGIDQLWIERLVAKRRKRDFLRVLEYAQEKGLFKCLLIGIEKRRFGGFLAKWVRESEDYFALRRLAMSGKGDEFNGKAALDLFIDYLPQIREMTGDPEWPARYFAIKLLLHDNDERSLRAIWEEFSDSHPLIRMTLAREFRSADQEKLLSVLSNLFLNDPCFEVRKIAWERTLSDLSNYSVSSKYTEKFTREQAHHLLELLKTNSKADENFAFKYLDSQDLELRFIASRFLEKSGALDRLCLEVDFGDRQLMERNSELLKNASEVNITSFLTSAERTHNPASLLICIQILKEVGNRNLITEIAKKVFRLFDGNHDHLELYRVTVESISNRGDDEAMKLLDRELVKRKNDSVLLEIILSLIPARSESFFMDTLFIFLKDPNFIAKKALRSTLRRMPQSLVLPEIFAIIKAGRDIYSHKVRIEAFTILGELSLPYCLQTLLENFPILPLDEARQFAAVLAGYPKETLKEKINLFLESNDCQIRASLINCLSSMEEKDFLPVIRKALNDADPDVRISSLWALAEFSDTRAINQTFSMLRDPVERVQREAARALGSYGSDSILDKIDELLKDENEVFAVKEATILGLSTSVSLKSIDILTERLESEEILTCNLIEAIAAKKKKKEITRLIENFKNASQKVRDYISEAFVKMGATGEEALVELLREDISSLKPFITDVLDTTGYTESTIRKLSHREGEVRRDAAAILSLIGTESAFRGMVLAARDPDKEVRVKVIKALEKLETEEGKDVLTTLENDPDKRIRKYTHWALERLRAKKL